MPQTLSIIALPENKIQRSKWKKFRISYIPPFHSLKVPDGTGCDESHLDLVLKLYMWTLKEYVAVRGLEQG